MASTTKKSYSESDSGVIKSQGLYLDVFYDAQEQFAAGKAEQSSSKTLIKSPKNATIRLSESKVLFPDIESKKPTYGILSETFPSTRFITHGSASAHDCAADSLVAKEGHAKDFKKLIDTLSKSSSQERKCNRHNMRSSKLSGPKPSFAGNKEVAKSEYASLQPHNASEERHIEWDTKTLKARSTKSSDSKVSKLYRSLKRAVKIEVKYYRSLIPQAIHQNFPFNLHSPRRSIRQRLETWRRVTIGDRIGYAKYSLRNITERKVGAPDVYKGPGKTPLESGLRDTDGTNEPEGERHGEGDLDGAMNRRRLAAMQESQSGCVGMNPLRISAYPKSKKSRRETERRLRERTSILSNPFLDRHMRRQRMQASAARIGEHNRFVFKLYDWWYHGPRPFPNPIRWQAPMNETPSTGGVGKLAGGMVYMHWYDDDDKLRRGGLRDYWRWRTRRRTIRKADKIEAEQLGKQNNNVSTATSSIKDSLSTAWEVLKEDKKSFLEPTQQDRHAANIPRSQTYPIYTPNNTKALPARQVH